MTTKNSAIASAELARDERTLLALELPGNVLFLFLFRFRFGLYSVLAGIRAEADWALAEMACAEGASA